MSRLVSLSTILEFQKLLLQKKDAYIFGKGPTFQSRQKKSDTELYICVNDSINLIDNCDILVVNDIETFKKINKEKLKSLPFILLPERPHFNNEYQTEKLWFDFKHELEPEFQGHYIIYHLETTPKISNDVLILPSLITGSNNAVDLIVRYLPFIQKIIFFGVAMQNAFTYNEQFLSNNQNNKVYTTNYINDIRLHIESECKKANIIYIFN